MELSYVYCTIGVFVFYHFTFAVKCQVSARLNIRAVYKPQTKHITVTWEDPPGSQLVNEYLVSYNADTISRKDAFLRTKSYEFTPPVLGTTYTIEVYADRNGVRSPEAVTHVIAATPVYSTEGAASSITLAREDSVTWEVRHDSKQKLVIFSDTVAIDNFMNTTTTVEVSRDPRQVTLTFNNVTRDNAGVYVSKRRTEAAVYSSVVLIVTVKPSTPVISSQSVAVIERSVELKCKAESKSVPVYHGLALSYSWMLNNTDIQSNAKYAVTNGVLRIKKLEIIDRYNRYKCTATEERGLTSDISMHILNLYYVPDVSIDLSSIFISDNVVVLTWISPYNGGFKQTFILEQRQTQLEQEWHKIVTDIVDRGQNRLHVRVVKNLKPGTSYQFKLYSRNKIGASNETKITITTEVKSAHTVGLTASLVVAVVVGLTAIVGNVLLMLKLKSRISEDNQARADDPNQYDDMGIALSTVSLTPAVTQNVTSDNYEKLKIADRERPGFYDVLVADLRQGPSDENEASHYIEINK